MRLLLVAGMTPAQVLESKHGSGSLMDVQVLRSGGPRAAAPVARAADAQGFSWAQLEGRLVELSGAGASALLTAAIGLVREAQEEGEPVAWVASPRGSTFYPPDAAASGVDLAALAVVRPRSAADALRAVDHLLRSGGFGLVVLDLEGGDLSLPAQTRFAALALRHRALLCCLTEKPERAPSLGGLISLRAVCERRRLGAARFACRVRVIKDKRAGPGFVKEEVRSAPAGFE